MIIEESDLDTYLANDPEVVAFILVGRPPVPGNPFEFMVASGETQVGSVADIYLVKSPFLPVQSGGLTTEKYPNQLFLPIGAVQDPRTSGKPILSTVRQNNVVVTNGGGGVN